MSKILPFALLAVSVIAGLYIYDKFIAANS